MNDRHPSPLCIAFIKGFEKCRLTAYLPTKNDRPTIGWGTTGPDICLGLKWTQDQADMRFDRELAGYGASVARLLGDAPTTQRQYDAMVSLAYNIGVPDFTTSTLLHRHKLGLYAEAADQFLRWNHQAGAVLPGLTTRRQAERTMYLS